METKAMKDAWPIIRSKLQFRYSELKNTDLTLEEGKEEEMLNKLQTKTGKSREQLMMEINALLLEA